MGMLDIALGIVGMVVFVVVVVVRRLDRGLVDTVVEPAVVGLGTVQLPCSSAVAVVVD